MVRVVHWKVTGDKISYIAECIEFPHSIVKIDFNDLLRVIRTESQHRLGSCKVIITYFYDIK